MADPLSIGGTALSVVSLGIQVVQGLVTYYSSFKTFDGDIADISAKAEGLHGILEALRASLVEAESQDSQTLAQVRRSIIACESRLRRLEQLNLKYGASEVPSTLKGKLQVVTKKVAYPFRKDTLRDLKGTLESLQMNLDSAVSILSLDTQQRQNAVFSSSFELNKSNSVLIRSGFQKQDWLLANSAESHKRRIDRGIQSQTGLVLSLAHSLDAHNQETQGSFQYQNELTLSLTESMKSDSQKLQSTLEGQTELVNTLLSRINDLLSTFQSNPSSLTREPALLAALCNEHENVGEEITALRRFARPRPRKNLGPNTGSVCSCPHHPQKSELRIESNNISTYWSRSTRHLPSCPYHVFSERVDTLGARLTYCTKILGHSISVAMSLTRGAGGFAISPHLSFVNVVQRRDSPAFSLLARSYANDFKYEMMPYRTEEILKSLIMLFRMGKASPTDVDEDGDTLLHAVLQYHHPPIVDESQNLIVAQSSETLIKGLVAAGANPHEVNRLKETLLETLLMAWESSIAKGIRSGDSLVEALLDMGIPVLPSTINGPDAIFFEHRFNVAGYLGDLIRAKERTDALEVPEIMEAIVMESQELFTRILLNNPAIVHEDVWDGSTALHLSVQWPWAVTHLLEAGAEVDRADTWGNTALYLACFAGNAETIDILLRWDSQLGSTSSPYASFEAVLSTKDENLVRKFISALTDRRRRLQQLAQAYLPRNHPGRLLLRDDRLLDSGAFDVVSSLRELGVDIPTALLPATNMSVPTTVYHTPDLTAATADLLYNAGFRDVDEGPGYRTRNDIDCETPIWDYLKGIMWINSSNIEPKLDLIHWFISKGVDMLQRHPRSGNSALFALGAGIGLACALGVIDEGQNSISESFTGYIVLSTLTGMRRGIILQTLGNRHREHYTCACSTGGRYVINAVLTAVHWGFCRQGSYPIMYPLPFWKTLEEEVSVQILTFLESGQDADYLAPTILTAITFNRLGLKHTCPEINLWETPPSEDEVFEIQEEDRFGIQELDELAEEFKSSYNEYEGSLTSFIKNYWRPRMEEVLKEKDTPLIEEERARMREIGVVLE